MYGYFFTLGYVSAAKNAPMIIIPSKVKFTRLRDSSSRKRWNPWKILLKITWLQAMFSPNSNRLGYARQASLILAQKFSVFLVYFSTPLTF
jgi:hypothetical protein